MSSIVSPSIVNFNFSSTQKVLYAFLGKVYKIKVVCLGLRVMCMQILPCTPNPPGSGRRPRTSPGLVLIKSSFVAVGSATPSKLNACCLKRGS